MNMYAELHIQLRKPATIQEKIVINLLWNMVFHSDRTEMLPFNDTGNTLWVHGDLAKLERMKNSLEKRNWTLNEFQRLLEADETAKLLKFATIAEWTTTTAKLESLMEKVASIELKSDK